MIDNSILYYLVHPFTTYGDRAQNQLSAGFIERKLFKKYGIIVINPICLPLGEGDEAMKKCKHLYNACEVVIFCPNWDKSIGCKTEYGWVYQDGKPMYYADEEGNLTAKSIGGSEEV